MKNTVFRKLLQIARQIWVAPIVLYQKFSRASSPGRCRYHPTCSEYSRRAVLQLGIFKGTLMGLLRILRCWGWFTGGFDPPPRVLPWRWLGSKVKKDYRRYFNRT